MHPGVKDELACRGFRLQDLASLRSQCRSYQAQWPTGGWHWLGATRACRLEEHQMTGADGCRSHRQWWRCGNAGRKSWRLRPNRSVPRDGPGPTDPAAPARGRRFVIGDAAAVRGEKGEPVPGVAPAAKQMGRHVGRLIAARIEGKSLPAFCYRNLGELATIGRRAAVVKFGRLQLKGWIGWLFWSVAHIYFLIGVKNRSARC